MNNHSHNFVFKYNKIGGIAGEIQTIIFNSVTKQIEMNSRSKPPVRMILSEEEEHKLLYLFDSSDFFKSKNYFPPVEGPDSRLFVLMAIKENEINSSMWSELSADVPKSLVALVEAIENNFKS